MLMVDILDVVQEKLRRMEDLQALLVLDQAHRDQVIERERQAEEEARRTGLMKVVNEGFWATFGREFQIALLIDFRSNKAPRTNDLLQLKDQEGKRIGEWVGGKHARERDKGAMAKAAMGDFVLYDGIKVKGEPYFAIPEVEFPFLEGVKGIQDVIACSPAKQVDELLREWMDRADGSLYSRIVGFNIDRDDID